jgi:hypothetical protein
MPEPLAEGDAVQVAADECPNDPVGEGLHYFRDDDICMYCGGFDMLREAPSDEVRAARERRLKDKLSQFYDAAYGDPDE